MPIPAKYEPELMDSRSKEGWFEWSLDFFTDPNVLQVPYLDLTIQLDVTEAYAIYQDYKVDGSTFFAFLLWHLAQTLHSHTSFKMRTVKKIGIFSIILLFLFRLPWVVNNGFRT